MTMGTTLEKLVAVLGETPRTLRGILDEWNRLDDDLREHYTLEMEWLLSSVREHIGARARDPDAHDVLLRAERAAVELATMGEEIDQAMGFRPDSILPPGLAAGALVPRLARLGRSRLCSVNAGASTTFTSEAGPSKQPQANSLGNSQTQLDRAA